jgi:hypothetical protein
VDVAGDCCKQKGRRRSRKEGREGREGREAAERKKKMKQKGREADEAASYPHVKAVLNMRIILI